MLGLMEPSDLDGGDGKTSGLSPAGHGSGRQGEEDVPIPTEAPPAGPSPDPEVVVSGRGGVWRARVLGRSGGARGGVPLLLIGFVGEASGAPKLEALVAGRSLVDLQQDALESALAGAVEPAVPGRKPPFFEEADGARRS